MKLVIALILMMIFVSCSQESGTTSAKLKVSMGAIAGAPASFTGGLMLYGRSADRAFGRVMSIDTIDEYVPNGIWHFYAIGWDGPNAMEGKVYCGFVGNVNLDGNPKQIDLHVNNANCSGSVFTPNVNNTTGVNSFPKIEIETCNKLSHVTGHVSTCDYDPLNTTPKNDKGHAASYKLLLKSFDKVGVNYNIHGGVIESNRCGKVNDTSTSGSLSTGGTVQIQNLNMPIGTSLTPFYTVVRAYLGSDDCEVTTSTKGHKDVVLKKGLNGIDFHYKAYTYNDAGTYKAKIFTRVDEVDVCKDGRLNKTNNSPKPYAAGMGNKFHPYVICTPYQLNAIRNIDNTSSFKLGKDIDLNNSTSSFFPSDAPPCVENGGSNFFPIGGYKSGGGCAVDDTVVAFTGLFDGNNKKIKHLRFEDMEKEEVGFIRRLGTGGAIANTVFEDIEIFGKAKIGIVGHSAGATSDFKNNTIIRGRFEASKDVGDASNAGALVGYVTTAADVDSNYIYGVEVSGDGGYVGGLVGYGNNVTVIRAIFDGSVGTRGDNATDVGGIAGKLIDSTIGIAATSGIVSGKDFLGGIVGGFYCSDSCPATTTDEISYTKSSMLIQSYHGASSANIGGIAGYVADPESRILKSLYLGKINHICGGGGACLIGSLAGGSASVAFLDSYSVNGESMGSSFGGTDGDTLYNASTPLTRSDLRNSTFQSELVSGTTGIWTSVTDGIPRLNIENTNGVCNTVADNAPLAIQQSTMSRGTAANPFIICHDGQFLTVKDYSSAHFKMKNSIVVPQIDRDTTIKNFSGVFDGNKRYIVGTSIDPTYTAANALAPSSVGIFQNNQGTIKNVSVVGANLANGSASYATLYKGILVGSNSGTIESSFVIGELDLTHANKGNQKAGIIAGRNSGTISKSFSDGSIIGLNEIGGIVALNENTGQINKSLSRAKIKLGSGGYGLVGGIVAINNGLISEAKFSGEINGDNGGLSNSVVETTTGEDVAVGGIVGLNQFTSGTNSGVIKNSYLSNRGKILVSGYDGTNYTAVGGVAGSNLNGTIENSYSAGSVKVDTINLMHGGLLGYNSSGTINNSFYFLPAFEEIVYGAPSADVFGFSCTTGSPESLSFTATDAGALDAAYTVPVGHYLHIRNPDVNGEHYFTTESSLSITVVATNTTYTLDVDYCAESGFYSGGNMDMTILKPQTNTIGTRKDLVDLATFSTYCGDALAGGTHDNYTCTNGWDVTGELSESGHIIGMNRLKEFFKAEFGIVNPPANPPVWELDDKDGLPRLLSVGY